MRLLLTGVSVMALLGLAAGAAGAQQMSGSPEMGQQITGVPSPDATTTIDGRYLPHPEGPIVVGKRFAKRQQTQWSPRGAHLLLQTRTRVLDGTLRATFVRWYPGLAANDEDGATPASAA